MKKELTKAEEQIMHAIWSIKEGFAKDVLEAIDDPKPAYNTVLTVIRVLVQKGFVKYTTYGKSNKYKATISKEAYSLQRLQSLKKRYFNNSNAQLLSFFMKENEISLSELNEIMEDINELDNE